MSDTVIQGDALSVLRGMADNSVDAIVSDPPAGIEFMGKAWDTPAEMGWDTVDTKFKGFKLPASRRYSWNLVCRKCHQMKYGGKKKPKCECVEPEFDVEDAKRNETLHRLKDRERFISWLTEVMTEALRVLKPGGHALIWALPRTSHWTATALEDAGFEVRDKLYHLFGSGFPKSTDISKQIDKRGGKSIGWFGPWLRQERAKRDISQRELAEHFKTADERINHGGCVTNWELGYNTPTVEQFNKLCEVLDLPFERLEEAEREVIGQKKTGDPVAWYAQAERGDGIVDITAPATPEAQRWQGYGTALKPSCEEWILCRKPLAESSIAAQVLATGTGGLNIGQTRVGNEQRTNKGMSSLGVMHDDNWQPKEVESVTQGRFPSHLLLSHSLWCVPRGTKRVRGVTGGKAPMMHNNIYGPHGGHSAFDYTDSKGMETVEAYDCAPDCPIAELDRQSGVRKSQKVNSLLPDIRGNNYNRSTSNIPNSAYERGYDDQGGASRYFQSFPPGDIPPDDYTPFLYQSKASRAERNKGCEDLPEQTNRYASRNTERCTKCNKLHRTGQAMEQRPNSSCVCEHPSFAAETPKPVQNTHPTVKSTSLMRWLIRLITPPDGIVLDPFCGSGSTCVAAIQEGKHFIGIEQDESYVNIANARIAHAQREQGVTVQWCDEVSA